MTSICVVAHALASTSTVLHVLAQTGHSVAVGSIDRIDAARPLYAQSDLALIVHDAWCSSQEVLGSCRAIRQVSLVPLLVVAATYDESVAIGALDAGADDYLAAPYAMGELVARLRALSRRAERLRRKQLYVVGELRIHTGRAVSGGGMMRSS